MVEPKMMSNVSKLRPTNGSFSNKLGMLMDMWQTRFLVLREGQLSYFKDEKSFKSGADARGTIDLSIATVFNQTEENAKKCEVTIRTPGRDYRFRFQTAQLLEQWCESLATHENVKTVKSKLKQEITPKFQISSNIPLPDANNNFTNTNNNSVLSAGSTVPDAGDSAPSSPVASSPSAETPTTSSGAQRDQDVSAEPSAPKPEELPDPDDDQYNDPIRITYNGVRRDPDLDSPRAPRTPRKKEKNMIVPKFSMQGIFGGSSSKMGASAKSLGDSLMTADELSFEKLEPVKSTLCGIGIVFRPQPNGTLRVRKLLEGCSALEGGQIKVGDLLVGVDELEITEDTTPEQISDKVLGHPGQQVLLKLLRKGEDGEQERVEARVTRTIPANATPTILSNPWKTSVSQHQYLNLTHALADERVAKPDEGAPVAEQWNANDEYLVPV